nr:hypothetical protein [Tanacetum cinerariifolium]
MMLQNLDSCDFNLKERLFMKLAKSCLKKLQTQFQEFFDLEEVTSSAGIASLILQENFKDYMGYKLESYRSNLLKYLDILAKCIDKKVYKYYEILVKEREVKEIKETGKLLNTKISHIHEIHKSFKLQSKYVLINSVQVVDASLVVTKSSEIESENNRSENALSKSVNEAQMQMQEVKVNMSKSLDAGLVVTESSGIESDKQDTSRRLRNGTTYAVDAAIRPVYDQVPFSEVNSRVKVQAPKTRNSNKPIEPKIHTQKPGRQIVTRHRFSPNKSFAVDEKTNTPRSFCRWIPTGIIFNTVGVRWVSTVNTFTSSTTKVDCEHPNGSNEEITNPYECDQTFNVSVVSVAATPRAIDLADSLVSTSIDQDAPSTSIPSSQAQEHSLTIS